MTKMGLIFGLAGLWGINSLISYTEKKKLIKEAREYRDKVNKPILNLGCGLTEFGDINADIVEQPVKNFMIVDAEDLSMFKDKEFSVIFASHIIEHVKNPVEVMKEMHRIADRVMTIYPPLYSPGAYLTLSHRWLITRKNSELKFTKYNPFWAYGVLGILLIGAE